MSNFNLHSCVGARKHDRISNPDTRSKYEKERGAQHKHFVNDEQCIDILIKNGIDVNELDAHGTSALAIAAPFRNKQSIALKLLNAGADPNLESGSVSAYEMADDELKSFFVAKGFVPNNKTKALKDLQNNIVSEFSNNAQAIINPSGEALRPELVLTNICKYMGQQIKMFHDIQGQNSVANYKMSLIEAGRSYKEGVMEDVERVIQAVNGGLTVSGEAADYCYDIIITA